MSWAQVADIVAAACFLLGAALSMIAAIGVLRLPDVLSRVHAASKPQVLGLVLVLTGLGFRLREPGVIGILVLLTNFTAWDIGPRGFLGTALLVVGAGLVAGAFSNGRTARGGLITVGVLLSLALIAASSESWPEGGVGDRTFRPTSSGDVFPVYRGGAGDLTLDLSDVSVASLDQPIRTQVDHGLGDVTVIVPDSADFQLRV